MVMGGHCILYMSCTCWLWAGTVSCTCLVHIGCGGALYPVHALYTLVMGRHCTCLVHSGCGRALYHDTCLVHIDYWRALYPLHALYTLVMGGHCILYMPCTHRLWAGTVSCTCLVHIDCGRALYLPSKHKAFSEPNQNVSVSFLGGFG